jgi:hypothetical protein
MRGSPRQDIFIPFSHTFILYYPCTCTIHRTGTFGPNAKLFIWKILLLYRVNHCTQNAVFFSKTFWARTLARNPPVQCTYCMGAGDTMYTHIQNGLPRNSLEHASWADVVPKQGIACYRLPLCFCFLPAVGAELRASAAPPSPREANRTALRTLRTSFRSPPPPPSSPPPWRLTLFDDELSSFLISARFALFSASTDLSVGSN